MTTRTTRRGPGTRAGLTRRHGLRCALAGLALLLPGGLGAQQPDLIDFELQDQFERSWRDEDFSGRVTVVLGADRGGADYSEGWGEALHRRLEDTAWGDGVAVVPVALVTGVPFFMKGAVRGSLSDEPERWVLLDWDGVFAERYTLVEDHANLLVFDPDGTFLRRLAVQEVEPDVLDDLIEVLRAAVPTTPATAPAAGGGGGA
jgi:hypothetical protein